MRKFGFQVKRVIDGCRLLYIDQVLHMDSPNLIPYCDVSITPENFAIVCNNQQNAIKK